MYKGTIFFGGSVYKKSENPNCSLRYKFGKKEKKLIQFKEIKTPINMSPQEILCVKRM